MTEQAIATWSSHTVQDTDPRLDQLPTTQALKRDIELHSHYRAKTFVCQPGHNPLLSAGAPLLTLLARLRQAKHYEQINELFNNLVHEIQAFCCLAERYRYQHKHIIIARYLIASTLDDVISQSRWGRKAWSCNKLRDYFFSSQQKHEQILEIIAQLLREGAEHVDLLEFAYVCLRLGYKAQFKKTNTSYLSKLQQQLYDITQYHRGQTLTEAIIQFKNKRNYSLKTGLASLSLCVIIAAIFYMGITAVQLDKNHVVAQQLQDIQQIEKV